MFFASYLLTGIFLYSRKTIWKSKHTKENIYYPGCFSAIWCIANAKAILFTYLTHTQNKVCVLLLCNIGRVWSNLSSHLNVLLVSESDLSKTIRRPGSGQCLNEARPVQQHHQLITNTHLMHTDTHNTPVSCFGLMTKLSFTKTAVCWFCVVLLFSTIPFEILSAAMKSSYK